MFKYLFATPYTPSSPSDRSGDLLGWRLLRQQLQRQLFAPFTVLTPKRHLAEVLMISLKLMHDQELTKVFSRASMTNEKKLMRHLEILFGLASIFGAGSPKNFDDLRSNAAQNPYGMLNIERIQAFLGNNTREKLQYSKQDPYLDKLSYGIRPHYMSSLRRFGIVDESRQLCKTTLNLFPLTDNQYKKVSEIVKHWFGSGVTFQELQTLHDNIWKPLTTKYGKRSDLWRSHVKNSPELANTVLPTLCKLNIKAATDDKLKLEVYRFALANAHNGGIKGSIDLRDCLVRCRTFEVVTTLADFLLYCLILFAESQTKGEKTLSAFCKVNSRWLHQVTARLVEALGLAQEFGMTELHNWLELSPEGKSVSERDVLQAILLRHSRKKGSTMTFVDYSEESDSLTRTERQLDTLRKAEPLQRKLDTAETMPLPELIRTDTSPDMLEGLLKNDEDWRSFIDGNFLWQTFGSWFGLLLAETDSNNPAT